MKMQHEREGISSATTMRVAGVGLIALTMYMLGSQGSIERTAHALPSASSEPSLVVNQLMPPTLVLSANQRAVVGAADGLFYLVDYEGNSQLIKGERRSDLEWHRGPVLPLVH